MSFRKPVKSLYGSICMEKGYCPQCKGYAFIIDGNLSCCDTPYNPDSTHYKLERTAEGEKKRGRISQKIREELLESQDYRCYYCDAGLYGYYTRKGRMYKIRIECDHVDPWIVTRCNHKHNLVMSCRVCNGTKGSNYFNNMEQIIEYVRSQRKSKGIENVE